ncbi:hypothetical protein GCM10022393_30600 [Aquimarina addita]|uniref:Small-conductance mechanosensitive channel n=1 Tax=Aquimarina addita TaxID=870485 RepID=A0ABP6UPV2_9FLAO
MGQDIRELLKQDNQIPSEYIREGHQQRFISRLDKELPVKERTLNFGWLKIAASIVVILSVSILTFNYSGTAIDDGTELVHTDATNATVVLDKQRSQLAEISPEYQKAENYFLTSIKFELSQIKVDDTNRELVESFMKRLENLDNEYKELNTELIKVGPNMQSVEAMMENLTLRLSLLNRLKDKLKELEKIQNENYTDIQV